MTLLGDTVAKPLSSHVTMRRFGQMTMSLQTWLFLPDLPGQLALPVDLGHCHFDCNLRPIVEHRVRTAMVDQMAKAEEAHDLALTPPFPFPNLRSRASDSSESRTIESISPILLMPDAIGSVRLTGGGSAASSEAKPRSESAAPAG